MEWKDSGIIIMVGLIGFFLGTLSTYSPEHAQVKEVQVDVCAPMNSEILRLEHKNGDFWFEKYNEKVSQLDKTSQEMWDCEAILSHIPYNPNKTCWTDKSMMNMVNGTEQPITRCAIEVR